MRYAHPSRAAARPPCDRNQVLASLPAATWEVIERDLEPIDLALGTCLHATGVTPRHVYFPTTAVVSLVSEMQDGSSSEVAVIGSEGIVGVCTCMSSVAAHNTALVQVAGRAWRIGVAAFVQHTWRSPGLMRPVLRFGHALMTQVSQNSGCNRHHSLEQRLSRWLLAMGNRLPDVEVLITQERLAGLLGVRREGVTTAANKLQQDGLIRYRRGRVQVLDHAGLQRRSCECHASIGSTYGDALNAVHSSANAQLPPRMPASPSVARAGPIVTMVSSSLSQ